jgi:hypothetical protein
MNVVAAIGQFEAKLSCDDPAAAIGGVTRNSDAHFQISFRAYLM